MPSENITEAIDYLTEAVQGFTAVFAIINSFAVVFMLIAIFAIMAVWMTCCMFTSKNMVLGFVSLILWALVGAVFYMIPDMYLDADEEFWFWAVNWWRLIAFAFFGIGIMMPFAAYALRTKKEDIKEGDEFIDEGKDDVQFIDEGGKPDSNIGDEEKPRRVARDIRDRANKRRTRWE